jgi:hypothetical protein
MYRQLNLLAYGRQEGYSLNLTQCEHGCRLEHLAFFFRHDWQLDLNHEHPTFHSLNQNLRGAIRAIFLCCYSSSSLICLAAGITVGYSSSRHLFLGSRLNVLFRARSFVHVVAHFDQRHQIITASRIHADRFNASTASWGGKHEDGKLWEF